MNTDDYKGHTPAPWEITEYIDHIVVSETKSNEVNGVDAALIAAAPDLLAEVKKLQAWKKFVCDLVKQQDGSYLREMLKEMIE